MADPRTETQQEEAQEVKRTFDNLLARWTEDQLGQNAKPLA